MALGPAGPTPNLAVLTWIATLHLPVCTAPAGRPAPAPPPIDPGALAVQFWRTIPLPVPRPSIPPGYAITGKPAYLVTGGVVRPNVYIDTTPLGPLVVHATGTYFVDWGDGTSPAWSGPYQSEGLRDPDGNIAHTYDNVDTVTVTLRERWTATWSLGPEAGTLGALATVATIADFPICQLQAIITN